MTSFIAQSKNGNLHLGDYNAARLRDFLKKNDGIRMKIEPEVPENRKQRRFFEAAVIPLIAFYQEGMDYRNPTHRDQIREWLKMEFNSEMVVIAGKTKVIAGSTKGELEKGFLQKVLDWMEDQGYNVKVLNPAEYKHWRDAIYPHGGPDNYIDYLLAIKKTLKMNTRQKGQILEKYVCDQILSYDIDPRVRPSFNSGATNSEKADIWTSMMVLGQNAGIECKNQKVLKIQDWWKQTKKLESLGREPILVFKLHGEPLPETKVVIYLDTLLGLVKSSNKYLKDVLYEDKGY